MASGAALLHRSFTREERGVLGLVAGAFLVLGLQEGSAGALWPDVIDAFDVSNGQFGVASGIGLTIAFPLLVYGGRITTRFDKRALAGVAAAMLGLAALGLTSGSGFLLLTTLLIVRGIGICLIDLTANALAMEVEADTGRHLMSPLHSGFSGGAVLGAGLAWVVFAAGGGHRAVYIIMAGLMVVYTVAAVRERLAQSRPKRRVAVAGTQSLSLYLFRRADIRVLAVITGVAFCGELLIAQWIGIYLRDEQGNSATIGVQAVILLGGCMFIGRLVNMPVTNKLGPQVSLFLQGAILTLGGFLIVASDSAWITIAGCGVAGFGIAGMAPTALSLAGIAFPTNPGAASGATLMGGYLGVALMPFAAGGVASIASVRVVLMVVMVFGLVVVLTSLRLTKLMGNLEPETSH